MLHLVTPATEAVATAKSHMPGLHEFVYADALDFAEHVAKERPFRMDGSWDEQQRALTAVAIGFIHGEVVALTDRRDEGDLLASMPMALVGHPVWNKTIQLVGESPASPASLAVAMGYVAELDADESDLPAVMRAAFVAYGTVMGYERGCEFGDSTEDLPLPPQGTAELMSTLERLLETVTKSVTETEHHHTGVLDALYGEDGEGRERFRRACVHSTAEYATNAILSLAHEGHLLCSPGVVVGRIRAYASQFASGLIDGILGIGGTDSLIPAMFGADEMSKVALCGEPLPLAVRNASLRVCNEPLTDGMLPLAVARAWDLLDDYGEAWSGPIDIMPTGEEIGGTPVCVLVDADERITVSVVAYACGMRVAHGGGFCVPYARKVAAREVYEGVDEPAWDEVWDIEANGVLPAWLAVSASHPIKARPKADGAGDDAIAGDDADGQSEAATGDAEATTRRLRLV